MSTPNVCLSSQPCPCRCYFYLANVVCFNWLMEHICISLDKHTFVNSCIVRGCKHKGKSCTEDSDLLFWGTQGTFLCAQRWIQSLCNLTIVLLFSLKAMWRRKSLLNVVPLSRSRLQVCQCRRESNALPHQRSHRKFSFHFPLSSSRFLLMVV